MTPSGSHWIQPFTWGNVCETRKSIFCFAFYDIDYAEGSHIVSVVSWRYWLYVLHFMILTMQKEVTSSRLCHGDTDCIRYVPKHHLIVCIFITMFYHNSCEHDHFFNSLQNSHTSSKTYWIRYIYSFVFNRNKIFYSHSLKFKYKKKKRIDNLLSYKWLLLFDIHSNLIITFSHWIFVWT